MLKCGKVLFVQYVNVNKLRVCTLYVQYLKLSRNAHTSVMVTTEFILRDAVKKIFSG